MVENPQSIETPAPEEETPLTESSKTLKGPYRGISSNLKVAALAALFSVGLAAESGCKKKEDSSKTKTEEVKKRPSIDRGNLPEAVITGDKVPVQKPEGIDMDTETFQKECSKLGGEIIKLTENLKTELNKPNADDFDLIKRFVVEAYNMAYRIPGLKNYLDKHDPKDINEFVKRSYVLQKLLLAGGYYFHAETSGRLDQDSNVVRRVTHFSMAKITDSKMLVFRDDKGVVKVPLHELGEPSYTHSDQPALARYIGETGIAVAFKNRLRRNFVKRLKEMRKKGFEIKGVDMEELFQAYLKETLIHEGTHVYVGERYPKSRESKMENFYHWPIKFQLENGKFALLGNIHHPVQLHELCAVGQELFESDAKYPFSFALYLNLNAGHNPMHGYVLVSRALPLIVLKHAKGPEKEQILETISNNQGANTLDFIKIMLKMSDEERKKAGKELYELGLHLIQILQDGRMRKVKVNTVKVPE